MAPRTTLPAETTSFVGREADLLRLGRAFAEGARLVTVIGPPGIGKSRLGLRCAAQRLEAGAHRGGVIVCELVDASSADDLCAALRRALDVAVERESRGGDIVAELGARLGDVLVLLDNAEQLASVGPETIGRWLTLSAQVRFLATSRERLRLAGEAVHELGPLSLPGEGLEVARSEAVQLFVERARAVRREFAVSPENAAAIGEIVRQLDGIPLAIELGATRMGVLSPSKLLERMPRRFDVLSAAIRNPAARQRTLREAIDASFVMLSPVEQSALEQVSVFRGGFGLEAAEAVVDLGEHAGAPSLLDVLQSLVEKSLLFAHSSAASPGEVRFGMYLSIRDYAGARLEPSGRAQHVLARHASHFLGAAALTASELDGPADVERARRVALEMHNLAAVHRHMLTAASREPARAADALRAALALEGALTRWGPIPILLTMLDDALRAGRDALPADLTMRALLARGAALRLLGRLQESLADHEAARVLAERERDRRSVAIAATGIGMALRELGRLPEAQGWLDGALGDLRASGARRHEVFARTALERLHTVMGRGEEARVHREEVFRLLGDERDGELVATSLTCAAQLAITEGRLTDAELDLEKARAEVQDAPSTAAEAHVMATLAQLRHAQGRLAEARAAGEAAIAIARRLGQGRVEAYALGQHGVVLAEIGDLVEARATLDRAVTLLRDMGDARAGAFFTAVLGAVLGQLGHPAEGARLFDSVRGSLKEVGDPMLTAAIEVYRAVLEPERAARMIAATRDEAPRSHHVRTGLRLLARVVAGRNEGAAPGEAPARDRALVVSPDGRWCRLPGGAEVSFRRGRALRLMLLRLLEERLAAPDRALSREVLFASGWPGERVSEAALGNRVYVGVSRLRKLGFGGLLLSRDDGFLLDPSVPAYVGERPN